MMVINNMVKLCKKCGVETKRGKNGKCKPCVKAYNTAYNAANPGKVKARKAAYRAANPEKVKAATAKWKKDNKKKISETNVAYRVANREKMYVATAVWRAASPEKIKAYGARWSAANPGKKRIFNQNRRALVKSNGGKLSQGLAEKLLKLQGGKCAVCNKPLSDKFHLDHVMPLKLGGLNVDSNIQLLHPLCNKQKKAKHPEAFMRERGKLL